MKYIIIPAICAVVVIVIAAAWETSQKEQHRTEVAKACIDAGGIYSESVFRRRPKCKIKP